MLSFPFFPLEAPAWEEGPAGSLLRRKLGELELLASGNHLPSSPSASHSVRIAGQLKCYLIQEAFHQTSTHSLRKFLDPPPLDMRSSFLGRNEALGVRRKPGLSPKGNGWNKQMWLKSRWHKVLGGGQSDQSGAGWEAGGLRRLQPQLLLWRASTRW